jgi:hypothetical protein
MAAEPNPIIQLGLLLSRPEWISVSRQLASQPVDCFFHEWAKTWKTVDHKIR